jgi:pimeloyl-ACP methyl ester carboxylesterase
MNENKYREAEQAFWATTGLSPTEHMVRLPRIGTRVRVQQVGEGPDVLFVHGGPNTGSTWLPLVEHLNGFRCWLLDRPGTGLSERYRPTQDNFVPFFEHLIGDTLDGLQLDRAHIVASSLGGYAALRSLSVEPHRADRMVQMACPALLPGQQLPDFMKAITKPFLRKIIARLPPSEKASLSILRQIGHGASIDAGTLPQAHGDWYTAMQRHTDTMRNDFDGIHLIGRSDNLSRFELSEEVLARVTTPTHFIWGADDTFGAEPEAVGRPHLTSRTWGPRVSGRRTARPWRRRTRMGSSGPCPCGSGSPGATPP